MIVRRQRGAPGSNKLRFNMVSAQFRQPRLSASPCLYKIALPILKLGKHGASPAKLLFGNTPE